MLSKIKDVPMTLRAAVSYLASLTGAFFTGCAHTVISQTIDGPASRSFGKLEMNIAAHGSTGRAYDDEANKMVELSIVARTQSGDERVLAQKEYRLKAASLDWLVTWNEAEQVSVILFDYGAGVGSLEGKRMRHPRRDVSKVSFQFDPMSKAFVEQ